MVEIPGVELHEENLPFLSQQLTTAKSSQHRDVTGYPTPPSMLGSALAGACPGFVHAVTTTLGSYVHLSCCVQRMFSGSHLPSLVLILYLSPLV